MKPALPLKAIQAFDAASRLGSFAAAAAELHLTPSAVSHQIRVLETRLGTALFHRVHRGIELTNAGRHYADSVRRGFGIIDTATQNMERYGRREILTIHCAPSLASQWLMPRMPDFNALYPDIVIRLNASTSKIDLFAEEADFNICYGSVFPESGVMIEPFPNEPLAVLCAPSTARGHPPLRTHKDLRYHTLIQSTVNLFSWRDWAQYHHIDDLNLRHGPCFDRSFMAIKAAIDGLGVVLESRLLVERELSARILVMPFGSEPAFMAFHRMMYLQSKADLPKISAFRKWLFEQLTASFEGFDISEDRRSA